MVAQSGMAWRLVNLLAARLRSVSREQQEPLPSEPLPPETVFSDWTSYDEPQPLLYPVVFTDWSHYDEPEAI